MKSGGLPSREMWSALVLGAALLTASPFSVAARAAGDPTAGASMQRFCHWFQVEEWEDLPAYAKSALATLGWSKSRWEAGTSPASEAKDWGDLSATERRAAQALGASQSVWDGAHC